MNMSNQITLTLDELQSLLREQKHETAEYITRNLTVYSFFKPGEMNIDTIKTELKNQCMKSDYPNDYQILKKYLK